MHIDVFLLGCSFFHRVRVVLVRECFVNFGVGEVNYSTGFGFVVLAYVFPMCVCCFGASL